jgi:hypothetical protein
VQQLQRSLEFVLSRIQRAPRVADFLHLEDCLNLLGTFGVSGRPDRCA